METAWTRRWELLRFHTINAFSGNTILSAGKDGEKINPSRGQLTKYLSNSWNPSRRERQAGDFAVVQWAQSRGGGKRRQIELWLGTKGGGFRDVVGSSVFHPRPQKSVTTHFIKKEKKKKKKTLSALVCNYSVTRLAGSMLWKLADQCSAINVNNEYIQWKNPLACSARVMGLWKRKCLLVICCLQGHT